MLLSLLGGLLLLSSIGLVHAEPKVISMETRRMSRSALHRRDPADVDLRNGIVLYAIDVSVGTPAQNIALQIDTTNYDTWLPGPELASDLNVAAGGICKYIGVFCSLTPADISLHRRPCQVGLQVQRLC